MLSGYLMSVHNLLPHLFSVSWFPLIIMFFLQYFDNKKKKYLAYTALSLTMQFLAGAPEIVIMTIFVLIIITIFLNLFITDEAFSGNINTIWSFLKNSFNCSFLSFMQKHRCRCLKKFFTPVFTGVTDFKLLQDTLWKIIKERVIAISLVLLLFILLSSVQLLPFYELKINSIRTSGLTYKEAIIWSFAWKDFVQFFLPDFYGYMLDTQKYWQNQSWLKTVYLGVIPFILSSFYFISRDRKKWVFIILIFISFLFALGGNTPLYRFLYHIPPFSSVRYPVKFLFVFFFVIAVTSGLGFDLLKKGVAENTVRVKNIVSISFYFGFALVIIWGYVVIFNDNIYNFLDKMGIKSPAYHDINFNLHNVKRFLFFSFMFCFMLLLYLRLKYKKIVFQILLFLLTADLFLASYGFYSTVPWKAYMENHDFSKKLTNVRNTERYFVTPKTNAEFDRFPKDRGILSSSYAAIFGLYTMGGAEVLRVQQNEIYLITMFGAGTLEDAKRGIDASGIRYLITSHKTKNSKFKILSNIAIGKEKVHLYEYLPCPGRFLLFDRIHFVNNETMAIEKLKDKSIDLKKELILITDLKDTRNNPLIKDNKIGNMEDNKATLRNQKPVKTKIEHRGNVKLVSYLANKVVLEYESDKDMFLYVSDTFYPGWKAYIDKRQTKIYNANLAFRAIEAPKGKHVVVFKYIPVSFYSGLLLTLIGISLSIYFIKRRK
ncbi:MAG: YfhO family protein [Proteobacteria bacterium]|nr:YfhO family protein [Pseudomonadota bacterium]